MEHAQCARFGNHHWLFHQDSAPASKSPQFSQTKLSQSVTEARRWWVRDKGGLCMEFWAVTRNTSVNINRSCLNQHKIYSNIKFKYCVLVKTESVHCMLTKILIKRKISYFVSLEWHENKHARVCVYNCYPSLIANDIHSALRSKYHSLDDNMDGHPPYLVGLPTYDLHICMYIILVTVMSYWNVLLFCLPINDNFIFVLAVYSVSVCWVNTGIIDFKKLVISIVWWSRK